MASRVISALACLLVLVVLVAPGEAGHLTPAGFARIPLDGLLAVALILVLPARARIVAAVAIGVALGLLTLVKLTGIGFSAVLDRPFDPMADWAFLQAGTGFLGRTIGDAGTTGTVIAVAVLGFAVLALVTLSFVRVARLATRHRTVTARAVAALTAVWIACAALNFPVAANDSYDRLAQVYTGLRDREAFASESKVDAFCDVPGEQMLSSLRGKDVVVAFIESYGRVAVDDAGIGAVLDAGDQRLRQAGFTSRSAFLTSPTTTGGSWLAHATLLSGLWINNQQRYRDLVAGDRFTLNAAFRRAGWRAVGVMPGNTTAWPEGDFYGYDRIYAAGDLRYHGSKYSFESIPDQYTLSAFQRLERAAPDRAPVMATIPLTSSHAPWDPVPRLVGWDDVGDGAVFDDATAAAELVADVWQRDGARVRADYQRAVGYSVESLISFIETYGDDDLVLIFLGDHQPAPIITGAGASRDVPITIVARDRAVLDRMAGWGWQDGLRPGGHAPVWRMDTFRDRFLTTFG